MSQNPPERPGKHSDDKSTEARATHFSFGDSTMGEEKTQTQMNFTGFNFGTSARSSNFVTRENEASPEARNADLHGHNCNSLWNDQVRRLHRHAQEFR